MKASPRGAALTAVGPAKRGVFLLLGALLLAGCAEQLNQNTLALASTLGYLHREQVIDNLGRFIDDPDAIPAAVALTGGIVQVENKIETNWTYPYSLLVTSARAEGTGTRQLALDYTNQWVQNWDMAPVADSEDLKRLRALFRYAVYGDVNDCRARCSDKYDLESEYEATFIRDVQGRPHKVEPVPRVGHEVHTGWLYWSEPGSDKPVLPTPPAAPVEAIGVYGSRVLYTTSQEFFGDFVIAMLGATVQTRTETHSTMGPLLNP